MIDIFPDACGFFCGWVIFAAFIPSMLWLAVFWYQDRHPEPGRAIARVFVWGILVAIPIVAAESLLSTYVAPLLGTSAIWIFQFLGIAFVEELGKYGVVRFKATPTRVFNEPQDAVLYMVTAALGFAAIENVFYALSVYEYGFGASIIAIGGRFLTANLLHVIASGIVGYGIAYAYFTRFSHMHLVALALGIATILHGLYNHFIIQADATKIFALPTVSLAILMGGGLFILLVYRHMRTWPNHFSKN